MVQNEKYVWEIMALTLTALIAWNYWIPIGVVTSPVFYVFGSGDFYVFRRAGELWLAHLNPYTLNGVTGFIYPPTFLPVFGLLALIDFRLSSELWLLLYLFVFAVAFLALGRTLDIERKRLYVLTTILLFITSYPVISLIEDGQIDLLVAAVAILGLALHREGHSFASAFALSLATLLKGPAIVLLIYFVLFYRDVRYLGYFLVSTLAIVGASLLLVPVDLYWYYLVNVLPKLSIAGNQGTFEIAGTISIVKFFSIAGLSSITPVVSIIGFIVFGIFAFWAGSRTSQSISRRPIFADALFLMNVLVMLQFIARTWNHSYVWVILPVALALSALLMEKVNAWYLAVLGLAIFMLNSITELKLYGSGSLPVFQEPMELIGNVILTFALAVIYVRPSIIFKIDDRKPWQRPHQLN